jgi:phosphohistidine swiveling domain-containing protein
MELTGSSAGSGFWERRESRYPLPMTRHLWELVTPAFHEGTKRAFERYGCAIESFEIARIQGRRYVRARIVDSPEQLLDRRKTAEQVWQGKLWRQDCAAWPAMKDSLRCRLLGFARQDPAKMPRRDLKEHIIELRNVFCEGTVQHFIQQPASMIPVGDWVRRTHETTGASICEIISILQSCRSSLADCVHMIDEFVEKIRLNPDVVALVHDPRIPAASRLESLRQVSRRLGGDIDAYMDEYADRVVTGFDIADATLRELPACTLSLIASRIDGDPSKRDGASGGSPSAENSIRERVPGPRLAEFEEGLVEARAAYGLHDEDVRTTYLWPLGLMRRAILVAAQQLVSGGALRACEDVFQTTPEELDALMSGESPVAAEEISRRTDEWRAWANEEPPLTFGSPESIPSEEIQGTACARISSAISFYLSEMEGCETYPIPQTAGLMLQGLAASRGRYEGRARIVRDPSDLARVSKGDVLVAQSTSPAYNVILPTVGAVVTDRGGTLCHAAIIAREFSVPAVVGINQATSRIPDGAQVLVDGDHGVVAIRA